MLSGEFQVVNPHLLKDLTELGLWNEELRLRIIANNGSVQGIPGIPDHIKALYKTVWELSQKTIIDMSADRGAFIDQSQSLNIHIADANYGKLTSMHFWAWRKGLKTGMYYLRTRPAAEPIKFTIDASKVAATTATQATASPKKKASVLPAPLPAATVPKLTEEELEAMRDYEARLNACSIENKDVGTRRALYRTGSDPLSSRHA